MQQAGLALDFSFLLMQNLEGNSEGTSDCVRTACVGDLGWILNPGYAPPLPSGQLPLRAFGNESLVGEHWPVCVLRFSPPTLKKRNLIFK